MRIALLLGRVIVLLAVVGYGALVVLALVCDRVIFQPHPSSYHDLDFVTSARAGAEQVQVLKIPSGDASITGLYLPNETARYTVLFSHGNAEDLGDDLPMLQELRAGGFAVFAYDYRGYGTSTGRPSEKALYQDVAAAYDCLTGRLRVPPGQVISFGRSLGSAAAIEVAAEKPVAGLIIEAPFLSAFRVFTHFQLLPWDKYRNAERINTVRCPVLVIHGRADQVVPFWHGERMFNLVRAPKEALWVRGAGHNDLMYVVGPVYFEKIREFASSLPAGPHRD